MAIVGLALTFCGLYYKLAVFPFHFWTPDVYQGASNETAGLVASLPKPKMKKQAWNPRRNRSGRHG